MFRFYKTRKDQVIIPGCFIRKMIPFLAIIFLLAGAQIEGFAFYTIENLNDSDEVYAEFTEDILNVRLQFNLARAHTMEELRNNENFPGLKFALYTLQPGDDLFNVTSRMYLTLDTVISLNCLASANDIGVGEEIILCNMRGVIYRAEQEKGIDEIAEFYRVDSTVINYVNHLTEETLVSGEEIFVPGGFMTTNEWSYFNNDVFQWPLEGRLSSAYGYRTDPFNRRQTFHGGIDIAAPLGAPVCASKNGNVIFSGERGGYGSLVIIEHGYGYTSYYGHLSSILVETGDYVSTGQIIGQIGSTGRSTGPHLHFEIRRNRTRENPMDFLEANPHPMEDHYLNNPTE